MEPSAIESPRDKLRRRSAPLVAALALFLGWSFVVVLLSELWPESGIRLSIITLAGLTCSGLAFLSLHLRRQIWRQRRQDLVRLQRIKDELQDLIWLSSRISPRRPLPLDQSWAPEHVTLNAAWEIIRQRRPKTVLELGSGLSSLVMAYALEANGIGELVSLEDGLEYAVATRNLLAEHGMEARATVIDAPLEQVVIDGQRVPWYSQSAIPAPICIDVLFVDGPSGGLFPMIRFPALPLLRRYLADDAVVIIDNANREDESAMLRRWQAAHPELQADPRYASAGEDSPVCILLLSKQSDHIRAND